MRRALTTVAAAGIAVALQVTLVNRLPLPHGAVPSLVLILVAVLAVQGGGEAGGGSEIGAITGFCAGLALDIAPPGSHLVGEYALVYCLIGYVCGRAGQLGDLQALPAVLLAAAGAATGEVLSAVLGVMLSDPEVTWTAAKSVLPAAVIYDVLLTPFVFALMSVARPAAERDGYVASPGHTATAFGGAPSALRPAGSASTPRLRLAGIPSPAITPRAPRREPRLRLAGLTSPAITPRAARREPKLRFAGLASPAIARRPARRQPRLRLAGLTSPAVTRRAARRDPKLRLSGSTSPAYIRTATGRPARVAFGNRRGTGTIGGVLSAGTSMSVARTRKTPRFGAQPRGPFTALSSLLRRRRRTASPGRGWLKSKSAMKTHTPRYASRKWVRTSRRRRARSRLGGLR